jgi:hypothetical protein
LHEAVEKNTLRGDFLIVNANSLGMSVFNQVHRAPVVKGGFAHNGKADMTHWLASLRILDHIPSHRVFSLGIISLYSAQF